MSATLPGYRKGSLTEDGLEYFVAVPDAAGAIEGLAVETALLAPVAIAYLVLYDPLVGLGVVTGLLCAVYLAAIAFRLLALALGGKRGLRTDEPQPPVGGWPVFVPSSPNTGAGLLAPSCSMKTV